MTYKDQFVTEIKVNGKILRVKDDTVYLPFGSEYSILLKNLNSRRASVKISIDGQDILDGHSLILDTNKSTELKGFLSDNVAKNKFKFIQKTEKIQNHRGDKIDDGMLRIEFAYEKDVMLLKNTIIHEHHYNHMPYTYPPYIWPDPFKWNYKNYFTGDSTHNAFYSSASGVSEGNSSAKGISQASNEVNCKLQSSNLTFDSFDTPLDKPDVDEGITVKGNEINQQFHYSSIGELEQSEVIIIKMKGLSEKQASIKEPITVRTKLTCSVCGTKSKSLFKFCPECGSYLE